MPLVAIAGLSNGVARTVQTRLGKDRSLPPHRVVSVPARSDIHNLYTPAGVETLLRACAEFALKRIHRDNEQSPSALFLFYVATPTVQHLLDAFKYSALPVPFAESPTRPLSADDALDLLGPRLADYVGGNDETRLLRREVVDRRRKSHLLLPPVNFHHEGGTAYEAFLQRLRSRTLDWDADPGFCARKFTKSDLPGVVRGAKDWYFADSREIVFSPDNSPHPPARQLPADSSASAIANLLAQLYRFGFPIEDGFHYDAQRVASRLNREPFVCSSQGTITASGTHVNVYPNDFIRVE